MLFGCLSDFYESYIDFWYMVDLLIYDVFSVHNRKKYLDFFYA